MRVELYLNLGNLKLIHLQLITVGYILKKNLNLKIWLILIIFL